MYKADSADPKKSAPKQLVFDNTSGIPVFATDALAQVPNVVGNKNVGNNSSIPTPPNGQNKQICFNYNQTLSEGNHCKWSLANPGKKCNRQHSCTFCFNTFNSMIQSFFSHQTSIYLVTSLKLFSTPRVSYFIRCLLYTSPSPRDRTRSRMPSSA